MGLKKLLKKVGKVALPVWAALLAAKLAKGKRNKLIDKGIAAADADKGSDMLKSLMPSNLSRDTGASTFTPRRKVWSGDQSMTDNDPMIYRKGGGIAKRGTGQALRNGGRVKSMGIAKRGGGAAKR